VVEDLGVLAHAPLRSVRSLDFDAVEEPDTSPAVHGGNVEYVSLHCIAGAQHHANHTLLGGGYFERPSASPSHCVRWPSPPGSRMLRRTTSNRDSGGDTSARCRPCASRAPSPLSTRGPRTSHCRSRSYPPRQRPRARRRREQWALASRSPRSSLRCAASPRSLGSSQRALAAVSFPRSCRSRPTRASEDGQYPPRTQRPPAHWRTILMCTGKRAERAGMGVIRYGYVIGRVMTCLLRPPWIQ
jgi:hypothetical protein